MKAFISGQLNEKDRIRAVYAKLAEAKIEITHDWTATDNISNYSKKRGEAGVRAELDVQGVVDADIYILMTDNRDCGKGMYVELGAALALASTKGVPEICIVGPRNHESIFYYHPLARHFPDLDSCLEHLKSIKPVALSSRGQHADATRATPHTSVQSRTRPGRRRSMKGADCTHDLFS